MTRYPAAQPALQSQHELVVHRQRGEIPPPGCRAPCSKADALGRRDERKKIREIW